MPEDHGHVRHRMPACASACTWPTGRGSPPRSRSPWPTQADRAGLDSVWVAEAWGQDAVSVLGHLTAVTERIGLGSALMQIPARTPAATAMTAATLDVLSGGRFRLGLGVSGPQVSEGWHGVPFARPLARTREYVEIVRKALAREGPLEYQGKRVPAAARGQRARQAAQAAGQAGERAHPDLPRGDRARRRSSRRREIADGWIPSCSTPTRAGAARAVRGHATWTSPPPP